jgi:hypothetical protein
MFPRWSQDERERSAISCLGSIDLVKRQASGNKFERGRGKTGLDRSHLSEAENCEIRSPRPDIAEAAQNDCHLPVVNQDQSLLHA